jgi:predicted alpha/beta-fold hydrolase
VASASTVLPAVRVPLLCLNALDDSIVDLTRSHLNPKP